jgi:hypothetical protein
MTLRSLTVLGAAALVVLPTAVRAQEANKTDTRENVVVVQAGADLVPAQAEFIATEMAVADPVKNAPYSAEAVIENVQQLGDGNRIVHTSRRSIYRDSEGRTRTEQDLKQIGPWSADAARQLVLINDPVAGVNYVLMPESKTARKLPSARVVVAGKTERDAKAEAELKATAGKKVVVESMAIAGAGQMIGAGPDVMVAAGPPGPGVPGTARLGVAEFGGKDAKKESLGKQTIDGVEAEGTRSTVVIPAGQIGNERDIEIVSEEWYSPDLHTVVMSRYNDPRFGETTFRLTNINRGEPARELFEVPGDYKVDDLSEPVRLRMKRSL